MKKFVFGSNGMLGKYVNKYLEGSIAVTRKDVNALVIRQSIFRNKLAMLGMHKDDVIINCMGITNKRTVNGEDFLIVNSIFPRLLADYCEEQGIKMIHISTDCVYSGAEGCYDENVWHDDENIYGISKSAGEPNNCTVIRTSIIGENSDNSLDLLEWVRKHGNDTIRGYTDHMWNGITCLQFAKICQDIISKDMFWRGIRHVFSPDAVTKAELIRIISEIYELNNKVENFETEIYCNRTLATNHVRMFYIPPIREQIIEQRNFKL